MDSKELVEKLKRVFREKVDSGLEIDAIGLAPAYGSLIPDCYVLGVSAPSMNGMDCYEKMDFVIDILFEKFSEGERRMIDRVRVYDSVKELKSHADTDFDYANCNFCEQAVVRSATVYEMT